jgi:DNA-binding MarR family transcriptional regulator
MSEDTPMTEIERVAAAAPCACLRVRQAARALTQLYDEAYRPIGLRATQFPILLVARHYDGVAVTKMAEFLVMDRTTLTRNLRPLLRLGLVEIQPGSDKRTKLISLTAAGRAKFSEALPLWEETQQRVREGLGANRSDRLANDLRATVEFSQTDHAIHVG